MSIRRVFSAHDLDIVVEHTLLFWSHNVLFLWIFVIFWTASLHFDLIPIGFNRVFQGAFFDGERLWTWKLGADSLNLLLRVFGVLLVLINVNIYIGNFYFQTGVIFANDLICRHFSLSFFGTIQKWFLLH